MCGTSARGHPWPSLILLIGASLTDGSAVLDVVGVLTRCVDPLGLLRRYIVKAEPIEAVLDREYYVKALNKAEDDLWLHWRYELLP